MKKFITLFIFLVLVSCARDEEQINNPILETPDALFINDLVGIKLANNIVTERVDMNVKLQSEGTYRIKIRHGMNKQLISQEKVSGKEGDNILKVYVSTLDKSSYLLELTDDNHKVIGRTAFSVQ